MRLLDLYCGAGGAAMGYFRAGFDEIIGVDIHPQKNYPFEFFQGDVLDLEFGKFDLVHASPPCQRWSGASGKSNRNFLYKDFLRPTRERLRSSGIPYVIENVENAPLYNPVRLCGTLFETLRVLRHRLFECSFDIPQPQLYCRNHPPVYTPKKKEWLDPYEDYVSVAGGGNCPIAAAKTAMDIDWMNIDELSQAIPPPYTEYIGTQFLVSNSGISVTGGSNLSSSGISVKKS